MVFLDVRRKLTVELQHGVLRLDLGRGEVTVEFELGVDWGGG